MVHLEYILALFDACFNGLAGVVEVETVRQILGYWLLSIVRQDAVSFLVAQVNRSKATFMG